MFVKKIFLGCQFRSSVYDRSRKRGKWLEHEGGMTGGIKEGKEDLEVVPKRKIRSLGTSDAPPII